LTASLFETTAVFVAQAGLWSPAAFAAAFIIGALVALPRPLLSLLCGFAFGWWGLPLAVASAAAGAALAFVVGRRLLRPRISARLARSRVAGAAANAVELEGLRAVVLLRLSPMIPSSVQSYMFSVTSLPFRPYMVGTLIGTLPAIVLQVWTGTIGRSAIEAGVNPATIVLWLVGFGALVLATALIGRRVRRLLALPVAAASAS
jgi:uncharacterized membrane protein YdjX (TVP38/TMEM64 family)